MWLRLILAFDIEGDVGVDVDIYVGFVLRFPSLERPLNK